MRQEHSKTSTGRIPARSKWLLFGLVASVVAGLSLFLVTVVFATPGDLDTTFAGTGKALFGFGFTDDQANAVALQTDGKIVVAGSTGDRFAVLRYNSDGSLDTAFDGDGKVTTLINGAGPANATAVRIQSDGKIV